MTNHTENNQLSTWQYAPSLENASQAQIKKKYGLFIGGEFVEPQAKKYFQTINPATKQVLASVAYADAQDVDKAVVAARDAYETTWRHLSGKERGKYLFRIARIMQERMRELAVVETLDSGKTIRESRDFDVPTAISHFFYYAGWADKLQYAFPNKKIESIGVAGQIIPWNFPILMAAWKIAPALACGNTVVLKPAETTPLTALKMAEICIEAQIPAGVVNILTGYGDTGQAIVEHAGIDKIAFTGSTNVGKKIHQEALEKAKKCTLELGGKSANIILDDAPIDQAVEGVVNGIFFNQGHVCSAGSRLLVQENIEPIILKKIKDRIQTLIVGNPLDKNTDIGAINSEKQLKTIERYIQLGIEEGAEIYQPNAPIPTDGFYFRPTLVSQVAQSSRLVQEEIFGPVLTIQTFRTIDEAIQKANNSPYGLAAGVWSDKGSRLFNMTSKLNAGVVWGNTYNRFDPTSPFGGFKESGYGREGGLHGIQAYIK